MKKFMSYVGAVAAAAIVLAILFAMADYHDWFNEKEVEMTLAAEVYEDGIPVEETYIEIDGEYHHNFWNDDSFYGEFQVAAFPETQRDDVTAVICWQSFSWEDEAGEKQTRIDPFILLYRYGNMLNPDDWGYGHGIEISKDMRSVAWTLPDGRIVATSAAAYQAYTEE